MISKKHFFIGLFATILFFFSCKEDQKEASTNEDLIKDDSYHIVGNLKNIPDSTWVFIKKERETIDSTQIINEKFEFTGSVEEPSSVFMKVGKITPEYFSVWVENQKITIEGKKENLRSAKVTGGKSQKEYNDLLQRTDSLEAAFNEINDKFMHPEAEKMSQQETEDLVNQQTEILEEISLINQQFISDNPNSYVSVSHLNNSTLLWNKEKIIELFNGLSEKMQASSYGKSIQYFISLPQTPKIGEKFIDFELSDLNENPIKISDIKSKYVLVEFWASWCYPCRQENPNLIKTYNTFKDQGFEIIGVSIDNQKKNWMEAIKKDSLPWKQGVDLKGFKSDIVLTYGIQGIPDNFLIDQEGTIIAKTLRGNQLKNKLEELFKD